MLTTTLLHLSCLWNVQFYATYQYVWHDWITMFNFLSNLYVEFHLIFPDNVHFQHTAQFIKALTEADVDFRIQVSGDLTISVLSRTCRIIFLTSNLARNAYFQIKILTMQINSLNIIKNLSYLSKSVFVVHDKLLWTHFHFIKPTVDSSEITLTNNSLGVDTQS